MIQEQMSPNIAVQAAGTNSSTKTPDAQIQPPATVGSDIHVLVDR